MAVEFCEKISFFVGKIGRLGGFWVDFAEFFIGFAGWRCCFDSFMLIFP